MKNLTNYIKYNIYNIKENNNCCYFICSLLEHLKLEFSNSEKYHSRYNYTSNNINTNNIYNDVLLESSGMYEGQQELINIIFELFKGKLKETQKSGMLFDIELTSHELVNKYKLNNIFFDKIIIEYKKSPSMMSCFFDNKSIFNKETNMFDKVIIRLNKADIRTKQMFYSTLSHELLHAFELFKHNINRKSSSDVIKSLISQNETSYQKAISLFSKDDELSQVCANIYHDLQKFEINAYISELKSYLNSIDYNKVKKALNDNNNDYNIIINLLRKQDAYNRYIILYEYILNEVMNSERKKLKFYNIFYKIIKDDSSWNKYSSTTDKLINHILELLSNVINKINKKIPKIFSDYVYNNEKSDNGLNESYLDKSYLNKHTNNLFDLEYHLG